MTHLREHWEGVSLSGDYTLERWLGGDDSAAYFQTSLAPAGRRAVVKLVPEAVLDGATPLGFWHRTRQLRHPNLIELLDCGRAGHRGEVVLYALFESPDDTLAAALSRSPLNRLSAAARVSSFTPSSSLPTIPSPLRSADRRSTGRNRAKSSIPSSRLFATDRKSTRLNSSH